MRTKLTTAPVVAAVGVLAFALTWLWLLPSTRAQISQLQGLKIERTNLEQRVNNLNDLTSALAKPVGTAGALPVSVDDLERSLPDQRLTEDLYAMIEKIIGDLGILNDTAIGISQPSSEDTSAVLAMPVQIVTKTSYDGAKQLLDRLTTTLRPLSINSVSMAPTDTGAISVTVNATAYTRQSISETTTQ